MVGVGGALGWDGAIRLQWLHYVRIAAISDVIPGQKTESFARDVMDDMP